MKNRTTALSPFSNGVIEKAIVAGRSSFKKPQSRKLSKRIPQQPLQRLNRRPDTNQFNDGVAICRRIIPKTRLKTAVGPLKQLLRYPGCWESQICGIVEDQGGFNPSNCNQATIVVKFLGLITQQGQAPRLSTPLARSGRPDMRYSRNFLSPLSRDPFEVGFSRILN